MIPIQGLSVLQSVIYIRVARINAVTLYKFISITATVSDVFDTKGRGIYYATDQYEQDSWNRRESRFFRVVVRFRFGKADATIFRKRPQQEDEGGMF